MSIQLCRVSREKSNHLISSFYGRRIRFCVNNWFEIARSFTLHSIFGWMATESCSNVNTCTPHTQHYCERINVLAIFMLNSIRKRRMEKETQVHNIVQMLYPHAMAILSAVISSAFWRRRKTSSPSSAGAVRIFRKEQNWSTIYVRNKLCKLCAFVNLNNVQTQNQNRP